MKVLVCGSRSFKDYPMLWSTLDGYDISELINGGAAGADTLGAKYAISNNIPVRTFYADWRTYGKRAGIIRNEAMLREGTPDGVIAFWDGKSRGTKHMIDLATSLGYEVRIIYV